MDWFLYDNGLRHEKVKGSTIYSEQKKAYQFDEMRLPHICFFRSFLNTCEYHILEFTTKFAFSMLFERH